VLQHLLCLQRLSRRARRSPGRSLAPERMEPAGNTLRSLWHRANHRSIHAKRIVLSTLSLPVQSRLPQTLSFLFPSPEISGPLYCREMKSIFPTTKPYNETGVPHPCDFCKGGPRCCRFHYARHDEWIASSLRQTLRHKISRFVRGALLLRCQRFQIGNHSFGVAAIHAELRHRRTQLSARGPDAGGE
jgi:hypothetical protein